MPLSFDFSGPYWVSRVGGDVVVGRAAKAKMEDRKEKKKKKKKNQVGVAPPAPTTRARLLVFHCPKSTGTGPGTHGPWVDPHGATELEKKKMEGHQKKKQGHTYRNSRTQKKTFFNFKFDRIISKPTGNKKKRERGPHDADMKRPSLTTNQMMESWGRGKGWPRPPPPTTHSSAHPE